MVGKRLGMERNGDDESGCARRVHEANRKRIRTARIDVGQIRFCSGRWEPTDREEDRDESDGRWSDETLPMEYCYRSKRLLARQRP